MPVEFVGGMQSVPGGSYYVVRPPVGETWALSPFGTDNAQYTGAYITTVSGRAQIYVADTSRSGELDYVNRAIKRMPINNDGWLEFKAVSQPRVFGYTGVKL